MGNAKRWFCMDMNEMEAVGDKVTVGLDFPIFVEEDEFNAVERLAESCAAEVLDLRSQLSAALAALEGVKRDAERMDVQATTFMCYLRLQYPAANSLNGYRLTDEVTDFHKRWTDARASTLSAQPADGGGKS